MFVKMLINLVSASATKAPATPIIIAIRVTTSTRGLAIKSPRRDAATADMCSEFSRGPAVFDASRAGDIPSWNGGPYGLESSGVLLLAHPDSAPARRLCPSAACGSSSDTLPDLPSVVLRVDEMEPHPFLEGEIAQAWMFDE